MEISDTGGSGRDKVWKKTCEMIAESDFPYFIMGHGYNQVVQDSPLKLSAHNDFLEIIYCLRMVAYRRYVGASADGNGDCFKLQSGGF